MENSPHQISTRRLSKHKNKNLYNNNNNNNNIFKIGNNCIKGVVGCNASKKYEI